MSICPTTAVPAAAADEASLAEAWESAETAPASSDCMSRGVTSVGCAACMYGMLASSVAAAENAVGGRAASGVACAAAGVAPHASARLLSDLTAGARPAGDMRRPAAANSAHASSSNFCRCCCEMAECSRSFCILHHR